MGQNPQGSKGMGYMSTRRTKCEFCGCNRHVRAFGGRGNESALEAEDGWYMAIVGAGTNDRVPNHPSSFFEGTMFVIKFRRLKP